MAGDRDARGRFLKGKSGNPGGRPAVPDEVKTMLKAAAPGAVQLLIDTIADEGVKIDLRIACAERLLERVYGKPAQPIEGETGGAFEVQIEVVKP